MSADIIDSSQLNMRRALKGAKEQSRIDLNRPKDETCADISKIISPEQKRAYLLDQYKRIIHGYWSNIQQSDLDALTYSQITFSNNMTQMNVPIKSLNQTRSIPISMLDFEDKRLLGIIQI